MSALSRFGLVTTGLLLAAGVMVSGTAASAAEGVPYTDNDVAGSIAFCDAQGHQVTGGRLDDLPFAAFVVSNFAPPAPYNKANAVGTWLTAYQPREGVAPGDWSGEQMTASSFYSDPRFPKAEVLPQDISLRQIVGDFPPQWDGFVQLRMYVKVDNEPVYSQRYPAADIKVAGDTWKLVRGGGVSCTTTGTARSIAHTLIPQELTSSPSTGDAGSKSSIAAGGNGSDGVNGSAGANGGNSGTHSSAKTSSKSGNSWLLPLFVVGAAAVVGGGLFGYRRIFRRSLSPEN